MTKGQIKDNSSKKVFVASKAITSFESGRRRSRNTISHSRSSYSVKAYKLL